MVQVAQSTVEKAMAAYKCDFDARVGESLSVNINSGDYSFVSKEYFKLEL